MVKLKNKTKYFIVFILIGAMLFSSILPVVNAKSADYINGFDKGPSYTSVVPLKRTTFIDFDKDSLIDDYAYLAAVPTAVFRDQNPDNNRLYSHPLLFYQDKMDLEEKNDEVDEKITLDAYKGLDYFMQDWSEYCNEDFDQVTLVNVEKEKISKWGNTKNLKSIDSDDSFEIAKELALNDWKYSDSAVVSIISEEFKESEIEIENKLSGTLGVNEVLTETKLELPQTNSLNPTSARFDVGDEYKYLFADCWWDGILLGGAVMIPTGDPDMQLYCRMNEGWIQTAAAAAWNVFSPIGHEYTQSYVYKPGEWEVKVTDLPTEGEAPRKNILGGLLTLQGSIAGMLQKGVTYHVDVTMYPGIDIEIPDLPPHGCRNTHFKLEWNDPSVLLGFCLIGPAGEVIYTAIEDNRTDNQEINLHTLGQCAENENYKLSVFSMNDISKPVDFDIKYSWEQGITEEKSDALANAAEGAVLASSINAPLLYIKDDEIPKETEEAIYKLGVENIHLIDIGNRINSDTKNRLGNIAPISKQYTKYKEIFDKIRGISGSNDVVFTTIDPWTEWYFAKMEPGKETKEALFLGPATFSAAHHGTPVIIIDNFVKLSSASTYHTETWRHFSQRRYDGQPSSAEMYLTGKRIYSFLNDYEFDKEGLESIITVADQFDIGTPWDRMFVGVANPGRFIGSPVDTAYWISRNMFYPALIFVNPALSSEGVTLTNGSLSRREGLTGLLKYPFGNTLHIYRESQEERFNFPVMCSFVTQKYRFNERASKYYGAVYQCADGLIPGVSETHETIDMGSIAKHNPDKTGQYFPDMSESEMVPFYFNRGGFDVAMSTNFEKVTENLNKGCIIWLHASHGHQGGGGHTEFWNPSEAFTTPGRFIAGAMKQENPVAGYDWYMGSTDEPDTMSMDVIGFIPFTNIHLGIIPATGQDWGLARKPIREMLNKIIFPKYKNFPFEVENLYDGVTGSLGFTRRTIKSVYSPEMDEKLENLHSLGFITNICQTANTYFQINLIRHGSVFQVEDPWATSWYATVWRETIPRDLALGYTMGEAYARGISHVGILYLGGAGVDGSEPQWWWDTAESVVYYGDPDLRVFVPGTEYSDNNYWEQKDTVSLPYEKEYSINGHTPFGATEHPYEKGPKTFIDQNLFVLVILAIIVILLVALLAMGRKK
jgi:hypothetical protein